MTAKEMTVFSYGETVVRTISRDGETWFVAKDVAEALGYKWNANKTIGHVPEEWRGVESVSTPSGNQEAIIISEPGLFFFLNRSDKPSALPMQKWVAGEVLPSIRKTGTYSSPGQSPVKVQALLDTDKVFRAALRMAKACGLDRNAAIISANNLARKVTGNGALELLDVKGLERPVDDHPLTPTEIGRMIGGISPREVNKLLTSSGLQQKIGEIYSPTDAGKQFAVLLDTGKQHSDGALVHQLKWKKSVVNRLTESVLDRIDTVSATN